MRINKQEQFTPIGREPSELLALIREHWWYSDSERQEQKAQISKKYGRDSRQSSFLINNWLCHYLRVGRATRMAQQSSLN